MPEVVSFTIVNAITDKDLVNITSSEYSFEFTTDARLSLRANVDVGDTIQSMDFFVNGNYYVTDGRPPYSLGDYKGDYSGNAMLTSEQSVTILAEPFRNLVAGIAKEVILLPRRCGTVCPKAIA